MTRTRLAAVPLFALAVLFGVSTAEAATCDFMYWVAFSYNCPYSGCPLSSPITFTPNAARAAEACDTFTWDFGDGTPAVVKTDLSSVAHAFSTAGTFIVKFTDSNTTGNTSAQSQIVAANGVIGFYYGFVSANEASGAAQVTVTRSAATGSSSVHYATSDGTAIAGTRYTASSGTVTFNDGELTKTFSVPLINDLLFEGTQYFNVTLSSPTGGYILGYSTTAQVSIQDDELPPTLAFATPLTGNEADGTATITVLRTGDKSGTVSVTWSDTYYGTSSAVGPASGVLTFNANETSKTFSIPLIKDGVFTGPRSANLALYDPTNGAQIQNGFGTLTINDAEQPPTVSVSDGSVVEGDSGTKSVSLNLTLSAPLTWSQYVGWRTQDGTAVANRDYVPSSGSFYFNAGETSKSISVQVIGNTSPEPDKTFRIVPSASYFFCCSSSGNVVFPTHNGTFTIVNDDMSFSPRSQNVATGTHALLALNVGNPVTTDYVIPITSSDPTVAKVPSSVTLRAGSAVVGVDVETLAHGAATLTAILPAALGGQTFTAGISIYDGASLVFTPQPVQATVGAAVSVGASMSPAQTADIVVPLASVNTAIATVPSSITIPAGGSTRFNITGVATGTTVITATLPASNGGATITLSVNVITAPKGLAITQITPTTGPLSGGTPVSLTGANFGGSCTLTFDGVQATNLVTVSPTSMTATAPAHAAGSVDVTLACGADTLRPFPIDTFTLTNGFTYIATSASVTGITPAFGSVHGGTLTSISGTNFQNNCWAFFDDAPAHHVTVSNGTTILATTPAHADGTVPVSLRCGATSVSLGNAFTFSTADDPSPVITAVDPLSGSAGQSVHLIGFRFRPTDRIVFDSAAATILSTTPESQFVRVPELPVGKVSITLTDAGGHTTTTGPIFNVLEPQPPHIDSATPASLAAGDELDLGGSGFRPGYTFWIGGQPASIVELSYTHALVRVGAVDAGHYAIEAHNASGGTAAIGPSVDVVTGGVSVNAVAPLCSSSDGGTAVTITGVGFAAGATVTFGGNAATSVTVVDAHTIRATAPAAIVGTARIVVTNPDGKSGSLSDAFHYFSPTDPDGGCVTPSRRRPAH